MLSKSFLFLAVAIASIHFAFSKNTLRVPNLQALHKEIHRAEPPPPPENINATKVLGPPATIYGMFRNPTDNDQEMLAYQLMQQRYVLIDYELRNEDQYPNSKLSDVARDFLEKGKKQQLPGKYNKIQKKSSQRLMTHKEWAQYSPRLQEPILHQEAGMIVQTSPHTTYSQSASFAPETITAFKDAEIKGLYSAYVSFDVGPEGEAIEGMFQSPNYPAAYPNNADIKYHFHIPDQGLHYLKVTLVDLDTEECCDRISVHAGRTKESETVAIYSGKLENIAKPSISVYSPHVLVRFHTDCAINNGKFAFTFVTEVDDPPPSCNSRQILPNSEGYIISPGYGSDYPSNSDCSWVIQTDRGQYVSLFVQNFDFSENDNVTLYNVYPTGKELIKTLSASDNGAIINGDNTNVMSITMQTGNHRSRYQGFSFIYNSEKIPTPCDEGVVISGQPTTIIDSPNYPDNYGNGDICTWTFQASPGNAVYISVIDFDTEKFYDRLYVFDGPDIPSARQVAELSGTEATDHVYVTRTEQAIIRFVSDSTVDNYRGFRIEAKEYAKSSNSCSLMADEVKGSQGYVSSANYPHAYPSFQDCEYLIEVPSGYIVSIVIPHITINIENDLLVLYDGSTTNDRILFTTDHRPQIGEVYLNSTTNNVLVTFTSGLSTGYRGFIMRFFQLNVFEDFDGTITLFSPQGVVSSPSYPGYYPDGIVASWSIQVPVFRVVTLETKYFKIDDGDTLTAYDGVSTTDDVLFTCSGSVCDSAPSTRSAMFLVFNGKTSSPGFSFQYYTTGDTCERAATNDGLDAGYITSPNYPEAYPNNVSCNYTVAVPDVTVLPGALNNIIKFDIYLESEFNYDFLIIYDGPEPDPNNIIYDHSGLEGDSTVYTTSNEAYVEWIADVSVSRKGYTLHYTSQEQKISEGSGSGEPEYDCKLINEEIELSGEILSPGYPNLYPENLDTCWVFILPIGTIDIRFFFPRFKTESGYDVLRFFKGADTLYENMVEELSGHYIDIEVILFTVTDDVTLSFHTDGSNQDTGFTMTYEVITLGQ